MEKKSFARQDKRELLLDVCWDCHALWFDQYESTALSPEAVIELFRLIHAHRDKPARPLADAMACPACRGRLAFTHDVQRTNRIVYHRCPEGHGRLTTFLQFLREKQFVRTLTQAEVEGLRATVRQVRCTGCGAAVDLSRDAACGYCRSPVAVLDAQAVEKALAGLGEAQRRRQARPEVDPESVLKAVRAGQQAKERRESAWTRDVTSTSAAPAVVDLVMAGIGYLLSD